MKHPYARFMNWLVRASRWVDDVALVTGEAVVMGGPVPRGASSTEPLSVFAECMAFQSQRALAFQQHYADLVDAHRARMRKSADRLRWDHVAKVWRPVLSDWERRGRAYSYPPQAVR